MWPFGMFTSLVLLIAAFWAVGEVRRQRRDLRAMRERLDALERQAASNTGLTAAEPHLPPTAAPPAAAPPAAALVVPPATAAHPAAAAAGRGFDSSRMEDLVGSVWLQNVGA